jgi:hypothetical protein
LQRWRRRNVRAPKGQKPDQEFSHDKIIGQGEAAHPANKRAPASDKNTAMAGLYFADLGLHRMGMLGNAGQNGLFVETFIVRGKQRIQHLAEGSHWLKGARAKWIYHGKSIRRFGALLRTEYFPNDIRALKRH